MGKARAAVESIITKLRSAPTSVDGIQLALDIDEAKSIENASNDWVTTDDRRHIRDLREKAESRLEEIDKISEVLNKDYETKQELVLKAAQEERRLKSEIADDQREIASQKSKISSQN